ncbi:toprim domain-containing protein [Chryseobacterium sp. A321]
MSPSKYYSYSQIQEILSGVTLLDYAFYLVMSGTLSYTGRFGTHHYFEAKGIKMAIQGEVYYDFKKDKGGGLLTAVMDLENLSFLSAVAFLEADFSLSSSELTEIQTKASTERKRAPSKSTLKLLSFGSVKDVALRSYFKSRGISSTVLEDYGLEVCFQLKGRKGVAFGLENSKGGYDLRSSTWKLKSGPSSYSIVEQSAKRMVIFEGLTDLLTYVELQYQKGSLIRRTLVVLNSVTQCSRFLEDFSSFSGYVFVCLDGDEAGEKATQKILEGMPQAKVRDVRSVYGISKEGFNDLNEAFVQSISKQNGEVQPSRKKKMDLI